MGDFFVHNHDINLTTSVRVEYASGDVVERVRTKTENYYIANGQKFKALRGHVPEPVKKIVRMDDVNFQKQDKRYFLIKKNASQIAADINRMTNLEAIDKSVQYIKNKIKRLNVQITEKSTDIQKTKEKIQELSWVEEAVVKVRLIEKHTRLAEQIQKDLEEIIYCIEGLEKSEKTEKRLSEKYLKISTVLNHLQTAEQINKQISKIRQVIESYETLPELPSPQKIRRWETEFKDLLIQEQKRKSVQKILDEIDVNKVELNSVKREMDIYKLNVRNLLDKLGYCPTCGRRNYEPL